MQAWLTGLVARRWGVYTLLPMPVEVSYQVAAVDVGTGVQAPTTEAYRLLQHRKANAATRPRAGRPAICMAATVGSLRASSRVCRAWSLGQANWVGPFDWRSKLHRARPHPQRLCVSCCDWRDFAGIAPLAPAHACTCFQPVEGLRTQRPASNGLLNRKPSQQDNSVGVRSHARHGKSRRNAPAGCLCDRIGILTG